MQKSLTLLAIAVTPTFGGPFAPPVELTVDEYAALERAVYSVIPENVGVASIYARRERDLENLVANVESGPYDIQGSRFSAYWLVCEEEMDGRWHCRNSGSMEYVFSGSTSQRIWLEDNISADNAAAILSDVLNHCNVDFDVLIIERPQLWLDRETGQHRFSAPKCHYEYSFVHGQPIRGAAFRMDTDNQDQGRPCNLSRLGDYMNEVSAVLHSNWKVPNENADISCSVSITQDINGQITSHEISECDYDSEVQKSIVNAITDTAYLPLDSAGLCFFETVRLEFLHYSLAQ